MGYLTPWKVTLPPHLFPQVRSDLIDSQISICAPEVLMLFSDNFDYQNVKKDFVSGVKIV